MGEAVFFRNLTTKGLTAINSGERYFEGYLTVQVKDKQGEVTIVDELMKVLPIWIDRGAPISDTHSNRIIGKGINYSKVDYKDTDGEVYPAIKITGKIHKNYELDNDIWAKIKSGEYKGLSFGGATKSDREPMRMKDGSIAYSLKDLEHYEVAVCRDPAVPLALITEFNTLAKAAVDGVDLGNGRMLIKCDKFGCYVDKREESHQAEQVELDQAIGNVKGQTSTQNTTRRFKIGRGGARFKQPERPEPYKGYKTAGNEAGLKAPEARNEALVYDDKTLDQPSETPLENQAKVKKYWEKNTECPNCKQIRPDHRYRCPHCGEMGYEKKKPETTTCEHCGKETKKTSDEKAGTLLDEDRAVQSGKVRPPTPKHTYKPSDKVYKLEHAKEDIDEHIKEMKKGEDWSNADGDRHGMYNQDTDEGGMGKKHTGPKTCKCGDPKCKDPKCVKKRDSVLQGYGGEQNNTGEVHWSGSGSPYPKTTSKGSDYHMDQKEWEKSEKEMRKRKRGKKKAIITNIQSRLKNLDFLLRSRCATCGKQFPNRPATTSEKLGVATRCDDCRFPNDKKKTIGMDRGSCPGCGGDKFSDWGKTKEMCTTCGKTRGKHKKVDTLKSEAIITNIRSRLKNIQSRIEISNFLLRSLDDPTEDKEIVEVDGKTTTKKKKKKEYPHDKQKDGEFGGMNTGEVEWTEPRDTANSRTKRKEEENVA